MGSGSYDYSVRDARMADKKADPKGFTAAYFTHTDDIKSGKTAAQVDDKLNPAKANSVGKVIRESFDSPAHPQSRAIAVLFDVTGSMGAIPKTFVLKLDALMGLLVKKGYLEHPHILFGAIGDAKSDAAPLQIGQYEAGDSEMDSVLGSVYLEGGGGGSKQESYELGMYFLARKDDLDCWNKRGEKGLVFFIGDERPYDEVRASEVQRIIGDTLQADIPTADMLSELRERHDAWWIYPKEGSYFHDAAVTAPLKALFGQNFLVLDSANDVAELIAQTIGVYLGYDINDVAAGLKDLGADAAAVDRSSKALTVYAQSARAGAMTKASVSGGDLTVTGSDGVQRL